jgi:cytochrome oxidase Cu insertion factor (SCO1/SenC/PrrC family)
MDRGDMRRPGGARWFAAATLALACGAFGAVETRLIDQHGQPLDARALSGHWLLVYFGYANCQEICPAALTTLGAVLDRLGPAADRIEPLFVTLDPLHDSPEVMRTFAAHFNPRIRALTGTEDAVADAARTFSVPWKRAQDGGTIDHGTLLYLVAPDGQVVQVLHPQQPVADMVATIRNRLTNRAQ